MSTYQEFRQQLDIRANTHGYSYALVYLEQVLKNLMLKYPEIESTIQQETQWLQEFNRTDKLTGN